MRPAEICVSAIGFRKVHALSAFGETTGEIAAFGNYATDCCLGQLGMCCDINALAGSAEHLNNKLWLPFKLYLQYKC